MNRFGRPTAIAPMLRSATPPGCYAAWGARAVVLIAAMVLQGLVIGCGGGGGTRVINPPPPSDLAYPQASISATVGAAIATDTPTVTGTVSSYTISPDLPAGLAISSSTGAISGTPTAANAKTSYNVTANNSAGSTTATISITVAAALSAPSDLAYPQTSISATVGTAIAADTPTVKGTVSGYSISPALPAGLAISSSTGAISGTPTTASTKTSYTITASNSAGSTTAAVSIAVTAANNTTSPSDLVYPQTSISATVGTAIATDTPTVKGTVSNYAISPALPAGLAFSSSTGSISGTPTAARAETSYTVTASNSAGSTTAAVSVAVTAANNTNAPSDLVYPQSSISATVGTAIATDTPTVKGTVSSYSISPALPAGLKISASTGAISGTPTAASAKTSYTVTASNSAGSTTAAVSIAVLIPAPSGLVYPQRSISAAIGTPIATDTPTYAGTVTSFTISPALPAGLKISASTGAISGTPTAVSPETSYAIKASNSTGSTTATISITVTASTIAPSNLVYPQTSISATVGTAIATDTPTVTGTEPTFTVNPALPAGLKISAITGAISGTPTAASAKTSYTVKASNSAGSTTAAVSITVVIPAPSDLAYSQISISAIVGTAIAADTPTIKGTVSSYTISPALPAGLKISATTGAISGTPTAASAKSSYIVTASNSTGSTKATISIAVLIPAPSNLVYPQSSISATVGTVITTDTPTVTGTVSSYTISPALPAGLTISATTGAISGKPTAATAETSYTVTASNSTGSTKAAVSIAVLIAAPSSLVYPQSPIFALVGGSIQDIPTVTGTVTGYTIQPALPAGLAINASTGIISGSPTAVSPQTSYTVTASNSTGSTSATALIAASAPAPILELGHASPINQIRVTSGNVLTADDIGHWNLWDYSTGQILADGDTGQTVEYLQDAEKIDLAGSLSVVQTTSAVEVYSAGTGQQLFTVSGATWFKLATDASYVATGSASGLTVWSPSGSQEFTIAGDYSTAVAFAAPGQVQIASGPAGANVIETDTVPGGSSTISAPFSGTFFSWFLDGHRFLATQGGTQTWVYSNSAVEQFFTALPSRQQLTGQGDWIWFNGAYDPANLDNAIEVMSVVNSTTAYFDAPNPNDTAVGSGSAIAILSYETSELSLIDLSGASPTETTYTFPAPVHPALAFSAHSSSQWVIGDGNGILLDGATISSATPRYFGYGAATAIAGSSSNIVVATAIGEILILDPTGATQLGTINGITSQLGLSSDGTVLATPAGTTLPGPLVIFSLPSQTTIQTYPSYTSFSLSASGQTLGLVQGSGSSCSRQVSGLSGSPVAWSDTGNCGPILLSPDGTNFAADDAAYDLVDLAVLPAFNLWASGSLANSIEAYPEGWIDNTDLLASTYYRVDGGPEAFYNNSNIYNTSGAVVSAVPGSSFPAIANPAFTGNGLVYDPATNAFYSLSSGVAVWNGPAPDTEFSAGALTGSNVVYEYGHQVFVSPY